jgi:uncharacterized protein
MIDIAWKRVHRHIIAGAFSVVVCSHAWAGSLVVHGEGSVHLRPDTAILTVGVVTQAKTPADAQRLNAKSMEQLISGLAEKGLKESDLQTSYFRVEASYGVGAAKGTHDKSGYKVSNSLSVTIRDLEKLGEIIGSVVGNGANDIGTLEFSVSDPRPYVNQARKKAFAMALSEAKLSAEDAGLQLGKIVNISNGRATLPGPVYGGGSADMVAPGTAPNLEPPTLAGEVVIGYEVDVEFELK